MERLDVFDPSNISITSYHTDEQECTHCNREHTLVYVHTGRLDITEHTRTTTLHAGECAFMRRDNHLLLRKIPEDGLQYHSIALKFTRDFLREFYQHLKQREIPKNAVRSRGSLFLLPSNRDDIRILFESLIQYFDAGTKPSDEILRQYFEFAKMLKEGKPKEEALAELEAEHDESTPEYVKKALDEAQCA